MLFQAGSSMLGSTLLITRRLLGCGTRSSLGLISLELRTMRIDHRAHFPCDHGVGGPRSVEGRSGDKGLTPSSFFADFCGVLLMVSMAREGFESFNLVDDMLRRGADCDGLAGLIVIYETDAVIVTTSRRYNDHIDRATYIPCSHRLCALS